MKKIFSIFIVLLFLMGGGCLSRSYERTPKKGIESTVTTTTKPTTTKPTTTTTSDKQVYIAPKYGKKYHYDNQCNGTGKYIPIELEKAKEEGYSPCKKCCK